MQAIADPNPYFDDDGESQDPTARYGVRRVDVACGGTSEAEGEPCWLRRWRLTIQLLILHRWAT
ncbi:hypothetical protein ES319_D04G181200v1 [Gossypium barbadense]|uniref:Uncharacterized protein n=2 Tax=Gossypium TaxID=3633 RepID=A0A5J5S1P9_GOSBA|nr:hypothetical protein ES319_D04G181200v1 [Gossypium barbadense]TYG74557.1 hypothetical protein ES288_D04G191800v1 [Gossypium darwinii]